MKPETRARRPIVWPAYLVAAVCFALAVALSLLNLSLSEQLKAAQSQVTSLQARSSGVVRALANERSMLEDLMDEDAQRYDVPGGQIVMVRDRVYLTMRDMTQPPHGKVYQAWTQPKGSAAFQPSTPFVPDVHGVAVVALPVSAKETAAVAISVEPEGGSKTPTGKLLILERFE